ncbi:Glu/Leu/Phe/Val dehydrogenase dimerization domain-containing protein [Aeromicrobium endophyticum]|uniref:Glu/Leu/Phe/Val dehydrogenase n=1 Tax=Aeromicrobium endophyticum TaxID=2292704 RepID=A0A371PAA0_9ACTN|nr:Glu/Leu/Phe/Val dehydrogenase dimerization domain-containing protein [Aeromicrobium endophyticum]REK72873.1 Glu/Leu/Phe/Val dehydrogenase [Aeromicrobium endophyticum]
MSTSTLDHPSDPLAVFERADELRDAGHEQIVFCRDEPTGLRAIIAIHDTTLGPGLGGTRFYPYAHESLALTDALRLSEGMTYKAAAAGMPLGGAKAVIIGDPATVRTEALLEAYGRFVESLGGRYYTAADVGTTSADLDVIGRTSSHVVGRTTTAGGSGDSGYATALGVFSAMQAAAAVSWGGNGLADKVVGVEGVGKVGRHLVTLLLAVGARVVVSDPRPSALDDLRESASKVQRAESVLAERLDVYAPCALGASLSATTVDQLAATVVCGAANNQLAEASVARQLKERSILWVPDYMANAGGLIQVGGELTNERREDVLAQVRRIEHTVGEVIRAALDQDVTTSEAARGVVDRRLAAGRTA